jgi:hypothetical protein
MRTLVSLAILAVTMPSIASTPERQVIEATLQYHLEHTQPFYKSAAIVARDTRSLADDERLAVRDLVKDAALAEEIESAAAGDTLELETPASGLYSVVPLSTDRGAIDWRGTAEKYQNAQVAMEVSGPRFAREGTYAVVRMELTPLRGSNAGIRSSICYAMRQSGAGTWTVDTFVAACQVRHLARK